ncbi:MAG: DUF4386 family protein [Candidatus Bathyarchaeota archaeon]|nr:DUF4386 family protein [Candidatus Bathyarchaeota archaeon]
MSPDQSEKGILKVGGFSLIAAGFVLFLFFIALLVLQTSPTLTPEMMLDNPLPPVSLYTLALFGELLLMPGVLGLYYYLKNVKKTHMLMATALWLGAVISFLISRTQIIALAPLSGRYQAASSELLRTAYLVSTQHAIEASNAFSEMALILLALSSIIIGLVMLKGVFGKGISYLVLVAGILTLLGTTGVLLEPLTILTPFGLILSAIWQIIVGVKLYKLG